MIEYSSFLLVLCAGHHPHRTITAFRTFRFQGWGNSHQSEGEGQSDDSEEEGPGSDDDTADENEDEDEGSDEIEEDEEDAQEDEEEDEDELDPSGHLPQADSSTSDVFRDDSRLRGLRIEKTHSLHVSLYLQKQLTVQRMHAMSR
ncbi:hypothetical protein NUW54_g12092 [Trametes sanguinea]|uniref:Uncharacterized protein n=1 Tax=Trametes sanguinea TaxID=158606 RepID=A0ACC1N305_9APHY|nr:hypothetical protein NUW54_g12092 [Trametes sanguinea]